MTGTRNRFAPMNLVRVMPERTAAPALQRAAAERSARDPRASRKACTGCAQNSTAMPSAMVRFTSDTAFSWMPARHMTPTWGRHHRELVI